MQCTLCIVVTENFTSCWKVLYIEIFLITLQKMYAEYNSWRRSTMARPLLSIVLKPACTFIWLQLIPLLTSSCCRYLTVLSLFYYTAIKSLVHIHCESYIDKIPVKKVVLCALWFSFCTVSKNCIIVKGPPSLPQRKVLMQSTWKHNLFA